VVSAVRRQLPVSSPLSLPGIWSAVGQATRLTTDPRKAVATLLAEEFSAESVVLCGSGTQALQLALRAATQLLDAASRTVALPAFTCYDVGAAAVGAGARIALYDLSPATLAPDPDSLRTVLKDGARVVVVSPLYGVPIDWDALEQVVAPFGAVAIEDAAQGHGATWRQRPLGSLGKISVLSFGRGKGWTGLKGGALLLRGG
jgi:perosamine synthetase